MVTAVPIETRRESHSGARWAHVNTPPKIVNRETARAVLWANVSLPGLGLWLIGQRALGTLHIAMSISGLLMKIGWITWFIWKWIASGQMPDPFARHIWVPVIGLGLFALAWLWAGAVSLAHLGSLPPVQPRPPHFDQPPLIVDQHR